MGVRPANYGNLEGEPLGLNRADAVVIGATTNIRVVSAVCCNEFLIVAPLVPNSVFA